MSAYVPRLWGGFILAVICVAIALAVRLALDPVMGYFGAFVFFIFAITVSAWHGGVLPGIVATVAGLLLGNFFFTQPKYGLVVEDPVEWVNSIVFVFEGVLISVLSEQRLRAVFDARRHVRALQRLASQLTLAEHRQRREIAQGLHDHLQQLLVAALLKIDLIVRHTPAAAEPAGQTRELLDEAIRYTRTLTADLSPPVLHREGLGPALEWLAEQCRQRYGLDVTVRLEVEPDLSEEFRVFVFQAVRELLFNVTKHARASHASVALRVRGRMVEAEVADDGIGFNPRSRPRDATGGFGLVSLRERLEGYGGALKCDATPGRGARMVLQIPVATPADEPA